MSDKAKLTGALKRIEEMYEEMEEEDRIGEMDKKRMRTEAKVAKVIILIVCAIVFIVI